MMPSHLPDAESTKITARLLYSTVCPHCHNPEPSMQCRHHNSSYHSNLIARGKAGTCRPSKASLAALT